MSEATVIIACNLPNGIVLHDRAGKTAFTANGDHSGGAVTGHMTNNLKGSHVMTPGCPRDLWLRWYKIYCNEPVIANRCVFAVDPDTGEEVPARSILSSDGIQTFVG